MICVFAMNDIKPDKNIP